MDAEEKIKTAFKKKVLYSRHAVERMNSTDRLITVDEINQVLQKGKIVENRLDDPRGKNYLLGGETGKNRSVHVVCSPQEDCLVIITAYVPDSDEWIDNFTKRREK